MKAVAKLFSPGIEASTAGEVIDFRGVHTNRDRKKRERERVVRSRPREKL